MTHIIHARFNPFEPLTCRFEVARGLTVEAIVAECDVPKWFWVDGLVQVNGLPVARERWADMVPVVNDVITLHAVMEAAAGAAARPKTRSR